MKILVELEFNENNLGPKWMNPDNLGILLYTEASTKRDLLKVISFEEQPPNKVVEDRCVNCGGNKRESPLFNGKKCRECGAEYPRTT